MLKRIRVRDYKSLRDIEVSFPNLVALFGANASGKSNLLDAMQLLSRLGTSRTVEEAFEPPYRGSPIESFSFEEGGVPALAKRERLAFSIEADLSLSDTVVESVHREIEAMRQPGGKESADDRGAPSEPVRERNLRYRVQVEMRPNSGVLRVADEYLAALNAQGEPTGRRQPFLRQRDERIHLRLEGQRHANYYERYLDRTILSMSHYPPHHPHLAAARRELENWRFHYFEPRERMRAVNPMREVRRPGTMGEDLAAFLRTLKALEPDRFRAVERALALLVPNVGGIQLEVDARGEVELRLEENGAAVPAGVLSEGALRLLGLLALNGAAEPPALVGLEEPENGVHPGRLQLIAEFLKTRAEAGQTQYFVTTHSPLLADLLPQKSLFAVRRSERRTHIAPLSAWGPLFYRGQAAESFRGEQPSDRPVSFRILRGDFDA